MLFAASSYDVEVSPNFAMCGFYDMESGDIRQFTTEPGLHDSLDALRQFWQREREDRLWIGFNNLAYDNHILRAMLHETGADPDMLYKLSLARIGDQEDWLNRIESIGGEASVDIYQMNGGKNAKLGSLKEIGVKLGYHTLQELPYAYDAVLTRDQMAEVCRYNEHDLRITALAAECCAEQIAQRIELSIEMGVRVLNKHDAAVAAEIMAQMLYGNGKRDYPSKTMWHLSGKDLVKPFQYHDPALQALRDRIEAWELDMRIVETVDE